MAGRRCSGAASLRSSSAGETSNATLAVAPVTDTAGAVTHFVGVLTDITERKRAEAAREEQMRLMSLAADVGVVITQSDLLADMLNRCTEALVQHLGVAFARIWTLNPAENVLELRAIAGLYTHLDGPHGDERGGCHEEHHPARAPHSATPSRLHPRAWSPSRATPWSWMTG